MEQLLAGVQDDRIGQRIVRKIWRAPNKGLAKINLGLEFASMAKATLLSTVTFEISSIENDDGLESVILAAPPGKQEHKIGTGETPIDLYIEVFLAKMLIGEHSRCYIARKFTQKLISFDIKLRGIQGRRHFHNLDPKGLYEVAGQYKEQGVRMFKKYPEFSHMYFSRAYKLLSSHQCYTCIPIYTVEENGVSGEDFGALLDTVRYNIAACLLLERRYEDLVGVLNMEQDLRSEKAMYRKAQALYYLECYDEALLCFKQLKNWQANPAIVNLSKQIKEAQAKQNANFTKICQKMFQWIEYWMYEYLELDWKVDRERL